MKVCPVPSGTGISCKLILVCHSNAAKKAEKRFTAVAQHNWLEMGILTITVYVQTTPDGQLAAEMYVPELPDRLS